MDFLAQGKSWRVEDLLTTSINDLHRFCKRGECYFDVKKGLTFMKNVSFARELKQFSFFISERKNNDARP